MYREVLTGLGLEGYNSRRGLIYQAFARLKEGTSLEQAQANVDSIGRALADNFPTDNRGRSFALRPLAEAASPQRSSSSSCCPADWAWPWSASSCSSPAELRPPRAPPRGQFTV